MASYDFSGPFVAARIVDVEGNIFPLWTQRNKTMSTFDDEGIGIDALSYLQSITVELNLSELPKISAALAPTFEAGIKFIDSRLADKGGANYLEVQFGYTGGVGGAESVLSPVYGGIILNPEISIGEEITIQLNAQGTGGFSLVRQTGTRTANDGETRRQMITRIAAGANRRRTLTVDFTEADLNDESRALLDAPVDYTQGGRTDWFAIWELANSAKCWLFLVGNELRVQSRAHRLQGEPTRIFYLFNYPRGGLGGLTLEPGRNQDDPVGTYPILSFDSPTDAIYLPGSTRGIRMDDVSDTTREAVSETINDSTVRPERTGHGAVEPEGDDVLPEAEEATGDGGERRPGDPLDRNAVEASREDWIRSAHMGVQVEIETVGIPDLHPGEVVKIVGVGQRFEGVNYGVFKVVHNVGLDGYTTQVTCISNVDFLAQGPQEQGPANTQEARPGHTETVEATADSGQAVP